MAKERIMGVYMIRNKKSGNVYIGASVNIYSRIAHHIRESKYRRSISHAAMNDDRNDYGGDSFEATILERTSDRSKLHYMEYKWMKFIGNPKYNAESWSKNHRSWD